jgi:hypothetical protein
VGCIIIPLCCWLGFFFFFFCIYRREPWPKKFPEPPFVTPSPRETPSASVVYSTLTDFFLFHFLYLFRMQKRKKKKIPFSSTAPASSFFVSFLPPQRRDLGDISVPPQSLDCGGL